MKDPSTGRRLGLPSLGPRGEGWLALQVIAFGAVVGAGLAGPRWGASATPWRELAAGAAGLLGAALAVAAGVELGDQLTPFPRPVKDGQLRDRGAYALARHPIYGGVLLLGLAFALATSPLALGPVAAGAALLELKRRVEEAFLLRQHPSYEQYRRRVRWRLLPFLW